MTQVVPVIPDFIARYPQVKVHITFADHMVDLVAEGDDIGIRIGAAGDESLIARNMGSFSRMICTAPARSEEHTSELQSTMRTSYAVSSFETKHKTTKICQI